MVSLHLLNSQVELLDFLILVLYLVLEAALLRYDTLDAGVLALELRIVLDITNAGLRSHVIVVLLSQHKQILELLVLPVVLYVHFVQSILIVFPHQQLLLDFLDKAVLRLGYCVLQLVILVVQLLQLVNEQVL